MTENEKELAKAVEVFVVLEYSGSAKAGCRPSPVLEVFGSMEQALERVKKIQGEVMWTDLEQKEQDLWQTWSDLGKGHRPQVVEIWRQEVEVQNKELDNG